MHVPPPQLTFDQKREFEHMFKMMDEDGSGGGSSCH